MTITEKTAYLKGLLEGMEIDQSTKEGKLLAAIIDTLDDIALSVADLDDEVGAINDEMDMMEESLDAIDEALDDLEDALDAIDEDLDDMDEELEEIFEVLELEEDDDDDDDDDYEDEDEDEELEDEDLYQLICPTCEEEIIVDEDVLAKGGMKCPACGEDLEFDLSEIVDELDEEEDED